MWPMVFMEISRASARLMIGPRITEIGDGREEKEQR